jgi:hypothetical protein
LREITLKTALPEFKTLWFPLAGTTADKASQIVWSPSGLEFMNLGNKAVQSWPIQKMDMGQVDIFMKTEVRKSID